MPICPKCGKTLSSEQALSYHLNRKYKCGTWKCIKCDKLFDTKFDLNIHEMNCVQEHINCPSYDILRILYLEGNIITYELDRFNVIKSISPQFKIKYNIDIEKYIGREFNNNNEYKQLKKGNMNLIFETI